MCITLNLLTREAVAQMGNTEDPRESRNRRSLLNDLATLWPGIPFLGLGVWLSWAFLAYSGMFWLSDIEAGSGELVTMYLFSTTSNAIVLLAAPLFLRRFEYLLNSRPCILGAGVLTALGSTGIILASPHYFALPQLFLLGSVATGVGTAVFTLKCGQLYSGLQPWRALIYTLLSQLVIVVVFFFVLGNENYPPPPIFAGGSSVFALTILPILVSLLLIIRVNRSGTLGNDQEKGQAKEWYRRDIRSLSPVFWKFLLAVLVFAATTSVVKGLFMSLNPPNTVLENTSHLMLLRFFFIIVFLLVTVRFFKHLDFGKPYLFFMVAIAIVIALIPLLHVYNPIFTNIIDFSSSVFSFLVWCLLAFIAFEKRILPTIVFGFGRGVFMAGNALGWFIGVKVMPSVVGTDQETFVYIGLAFLILITATLVFSEKDFDRLFTPIAEMELDLNDISTDEHLRSEKALNHERPYLTACKSVGALARLSAREQGIFELLALGRGSENIAKHLIISLNTVRTHTHNIYAKLDVHSRQELIELVEAERDRLKNERL